MTLIQLKYLYETAEAGSINKAAKKLFISQSALSAAIKSLENEFGITIFQRTSRGVALTEAGRLFYYNVAPIMDVKASVERIYSVESDSSSVTLNISAQHYPFCVQALSSFLDAVTVSQYSLRLNETNAHEVIEDVSSGKSDLGIIFISNSTSRFIKKLLEAHRLSFHVLHEARPHVFISRDHPLANSVEIDAWELSGYPYVRFDTVPGISHHFSEEVAIKDLRPSMKNIYLNDRQTVYSIIAHSDAFTIGSGLLPRGFHDQMVISVPIKDTVERMQLGFIVKIDRDSSKSTDTYVELLKKCIKNTVIKSSV